ncbi:Metal-pseudopaline receptor CntO [Myxococcaceae bacterium]|nr:Metal-pseudopaline receptor CntO [Myxococcaceae bacterium]
MPTIRHLKFATALCLARPPFGRRNLALAAALAFCVPTLSVGAESGAQAVQFDIPAQDLARALVAFTAQSHVQVLYEGDLAQGLRSAPLKGAYTPERALKALLAATPVQARFTGQRTVTLERKAPAAPSGGRTAVPADPAAATLETVVVSAAVPASDPGNPRNRNYAATDATTATKTDMPIMDTPVSVLVVPRQVMQDQQAYRLQDAVKNVSGVQQRFSTGGVDRFIVRGFDSGEVQYRNGVRLAGLNIDLANVQRVEVLKGPASVLYGRAEPGGLINIVTKRPRSEPYYALEQRFGSYGYYRTQVDATGPVTSDGRLSYGFDLSYLNADSFRDFMRTDRVFLAPSLSWRPVDSTEFNLTVEYLNEDRPYDSGIPAYGNRVAKVPISRQYDQPGLRDNREHVLVDFNWSHHFNEDWKFTNGVVSSSQRTRLNELYSDSVSGSEISRYTWFGHSNTDMVTVYGNLNGKFDTWGVGHNVLLGAEYYSIETKEPGSRVYPVDTIDLFRPVFHAVDINAIGALRPNTKYVNNESWSALYFQDSLALGDKFHLLGGGRYDWATVTSGYDDPAVFKTDTLRDSHFSPRVGLTYRPAEWLSVYGQWVESFGTSNGRSVTGQPFQPQTATQYEAGVKTELFDGRFTGSVVYFNLTKDNLVTTDPNNTRFSIAVGEARSQGVEFDVAGKITDGLSLIGNYAYIETAVTKDFSGLQGKRLPYAPLHSGSVWLKYDFQEDLLKGLSLGGGVFVADRRYGDVRNSFYDPGYARLDLYAAYRHKLGPTSLTTQLNLNNVTDTEYFNMRSRTNNQPAEPLTVIGSLRLEY